MNAEAGQGTPLRPCPFCGHLESPTADRCRRCRLALDQKALHGLKRLMGVWHLLDERSPTGPGVNWQKFCQLIESDHVYEDSIIRGPATHGVWQYAKDTPSVATLLGLCWSCHGRLSDGRATHCPRCEVELNAPLDWPPTQVDASGVEEPIAALPTEEDLLAAGTREREFRDVSGGMTWKDLLLRIVGFLAVGAVCAGVFWYAFLFAWHGRLVGPDERVAFSGQSAPPAKPAATGKYAAPSSMPVPELSEGETDTSPPLVAALTPPPAPEAPAAPVPSAAVTPPVTPPATVPTSAPAAPARRLDLPPSPPVMPGSVEPTVAPTPPRPEVAVVRPPTMPPSPPVMPSPGQEPEKASPPVAPAAATPSSRPAEAEQPEPEGAREVYSAKMIFAIARRVRDEGDMAKALVLVRQMMDAHEKKFWPEDAEEMLQATQKLIRSSPRPKEPSQPELTKMWQEAKELSDQALTLEKQKNLPEAFNKLAKVIYSYPSTVWPKSTFECFRGVIHNMRKQDLPPLP